MNILHGNQKGADNLSLEVGGLIDSHCHLDLEPLKSEITNILREAEYAGVSGFVLPGVHPEGWPGISAVARKHHNVFPAYGIHPMYSGIVNEQVLKQLQEIAPKGVAIGEIGLDPAYQIPMEVQEQVFCKQLRIAVNSNLPVLIHCRRAFQRALKILHEEHAELVGGIMHAYSGSLEMAREFIRLGFAISISGTVTWDNAVKPLRVAMELPLRHLTLETDAPDMTPQLHKGNFNRPAWITEIAQRIAEARGISFEEIVKVTTNNTRRVLRLERHNFIA